MMHCLTLGEDGSRRPIKLLYVNVLPLRIGSNLAAALRKLRDRQQERVLWPDAICINQNNWTEKGRQVPIMRDIYANARQVIVWLGEEADGDRNAFEVLSWLSARFDH